ncbi:PRMT5 arginine-N-methyltransferase-domain-containing protein [Polychytrium aggregatum]|uniref:PRMT5 arginine-N-methyltransferase-domain-containing protein n=1 Tax=Polychytrium aggregatum TaxID=110093 RepID=UPI0022FEAD0B|nr:PRMT5 arginine-N-methyltransferase-domain-containing protein [Polychytrium aggregatum]KAI9206931.1 PRMT5 arginine-N-methyltransferase-domain-containing protein [Polychytrium aggregatum]
MSNESVSIGLEHLSATSAEDLMMLARQVGYGFVVCDLLHPSVQRISPSAPEDCSGGPVAHPGDPFAPGDLIIDNTARALKLNIASAPPAKEWSSYIVGAHSSWVDLDSSDPVVRSNSEILLAQEAQWATHIGLAAVQLRLPVGDAMVNFGRTASHMLELLSFSTLWIRVPIDSQANPPAIDDAKSDLADSWRKWNLVRSLCDSDPKLGVALELPSDLPAQASLNRWFSEPVKCIVLPTSIFLINKKGYPVLPKSHQMYIKQWMKYNVQFVISTPSDVVTSEGGLGAFQQYLHHLASTLPELDHVEKLSAGYQDFLQAPLQPLMNNLESSTYEVFEKDPAKYNAYEKAIHQALLDKIPGNPRESIVVMVVGAGRGPLVDCALRAAEAAGRKIRVYALEKNPNAIVILRHKQQMQWRNKVEVVHSDMRYWSFPEKADILVSELLGSIGDNELSPECLDGAQRFLKSDGISIPSQYISYIAPVASSTLYNDVRQLKTQTHLETPYVVKFKAVTELAQPVAVWRFDHPNWSFVDKTGTPYFNRHNQRYAHSSFYIEENSIMHGIAGYFEAYLYKKVMISIHPKTHTPEMFSWFPLFFPLKTPVYLHADSTVDIHFWRHCDSRKVWYEWSVIPYQSNGLKNDPKRLGSATASGTSAIHNFGGRSSWIGL